jgi:hypothetical protein
MITNPRIIEVTIQKNKMGHLHIWKGVHQIKQISKYNYHNQLGEESHKYIQHDRDIEEILAEVPKHDRKDIENGFAVITTVQLWSSGVKDKLYNI